MTRDMVITVMALGYPPCLFLGYLFGRMARATVQIEETMTADSKPTVTSPSEPNERRRVGALRLVAAAVAVIGIVTAAMGYIVIRNQDRIVGCVVGYSNASSTAFKARAAAQNEVNDQLDNFMEAILQAFSTAPADGRKLVFDAVTSYNDARRAAKEAQSQNPLPEPPESACAELMD